MNITAEQSLSKLTFLLVKAQPFYGNVLLRLEEAHATSSIPTAAASPLEIIYNPEFIESLETEEANFIWLHELYHIVLAHCLRIGSRNLDIWNIAADFMVNLYLVQDMKFLAEKGIKIKAPKDLYYAPESEIGQYTTEQLYDLINKQYMAQGGDKNLISNFNFNIGKSRYSGSVLNPDLIEKLVTDSSIPEDEVSSRLKEILRGANMIWGNTAGGIMREVQNFLGDKLPWYRFIRRWLTARLEDDESFDNPNRNFLWKKTILPGRGFEDTALEDIVVAIDTSGSVTEEILKNFLFQVWSLANDFEMTGKVLFWDVGVQAEYNLKDKDSINKVVPKGGGGTSIDPTLSYINHKFKQAKLIIVLTDGGFSEQTIRTRAPLMYVVTNCSRIEHLKPHGTVIEF